MMYCPSYPDACLKGSPCVVHCAQPGFNWGRRLASKSRLKSLQDGRVGGKEVRYLIQLLLTPYTQLLVLHTGRVQARRGRCASGRVCAQHKDLLSLALQRIFMLCCGVQPFAWLSDHGLLGVGPGACFKCWSSKREARLLCSCAQMHTEYAAALKHSMHARTQEDQWMKELEQAVNDFHGRIIPNAANLSTFKWMIRPAKF